MTTKVREPEWTESTSHLLPYRILIPGTHQREMGTPSSTWKLTGAFFRITLLLLLAVTVLPSAETQPSGSLLDGGVRTAFNCHSRDVTAIRFMLCWLHFQERWLPPNNMAKVEHDGREHPCFTPQSTVQSQHGLDHATGRTPHPPESHLVAYRCVSS